MMFIPVVSRSMSPTTRTPASLLFLHDLTVMSGNRASRAPGRKYSTMLVAGLKTEVGGAVYINYRYIVTYSQQARRPECLVVFTG
jgi:hypothetical protein